MLTLHLLQKKMETKLGYVSSACSINVMTGNYLNAMKYKTAVYSSCALKFTFLLFSFSFQLQTQRLVVAETGKPTTTVRQLRTGIQAHFFAKP